MTADLSTRLLIGSIIFTVLGVIVIGIGIFYASVICAVGGAADSSWNPSRYNWMQLIWFFMIPPIIVAIILMWIIYSGTIDGKNVEIAFWLIATIPFLWTLVVIIYGVVTDADPY